MNHSRKSVAETWENAEALIEHFEQAVRASGYSEPNTAESMLDEMATRLRTTTDAQSAALVVGESGSLRTLAQSGIALVSDLSANDQTANDDNHLSVSRDILPDVTLQLNLKFDESVPLSLRKPLTELSEALLDIAGNVYLREQFLNLKRNQDIHNDHDQWIESLYHGRTLRGCFVSIAGAIATRCGVDRVSLIRTLGARPELVGCSNQASIDRRASQVRLLEDLVVNPGIDGDRSGAIQTYLDRSECQAVHVEPISESDTVIVLERFAEESSDQPLSAVLDPILPRVRSAIRHAIALDETDWRQIFGQTAKIFKRVSTGYLVAAAAIAVLAALFVRVPLNLSVDGKVVAVSSKNIFAPAEGIIDQVLVSDGDTVAVGTPLVRLRSAKLDLHQRTVEGTLQTARTRLDSLQVSRDGRRPKDSAEEKVLQTEIVGLETQLALIQQQQNELLITSPVVGRVDRWNLRATLLARPVAVGQHLLKVVSEADGWRVELNVPDQNVGYVLERQQREACRVSFRLRSDATSIHESTLESIADSADVDPSGRSLVLATAPVKETDLKIRDGATVLAQINCGRHPIGFVWFRGLVEWWRSSTWF